MLRGLLPKAWRGLKPWLRPLWQRVKPHLPMRWRRLARRLGPRIAPEQTFCVLAWKHLQINPEGTAKLCCRAHDSVRDAADRAMSLDTYALDDIWNSAYMQEVRRCMVSGDRVSECGTCYEGEAAGFSTYRTESNEKWLAKEGISLAEAIRRARASLGRPQPAPVFLQLNLGNLCNLKCRMCNSSYSSQIEADPVHSGWAPRVRGQDNGSARWSGERLVVRPGRFWDVTPGGGGGLFAWSAGGALVIPLGESDEVTGLELKLSAAAAVRAVRVRVNGATCYEGTPRDGWTGSFDLTGRDLGRRLEVRVEGGGAGAIEEVTVRRTLPSARKGGFNNVVSTRFDTPGDWHAQDSVLFGEILGSLDTLEELYYTGGEPLVNKKFHQMIDFLVAKGAAGRMTLQLNSNITKLTDDFVDKLACFRHVTLTLSIDAAGATYEYIRYPAKWPTVAENARKLTRLKNADVSAIPVLTAYNALTLTELFRFCDEIGIRFRVSRCFGPDWLLYNVLPPRALKLAAERFYAYLETECRPENRDVVRIWASALAADNVPFEKQQLPVFNAFTNELDVSRGQSFEKTFPELVRLLEEAGHPWQRGGRVELLQLGMPQRAA
jgi:glutamate-1-semialdehyde 2,1-aminomutase